MMYGGFVTVLAFTSRYWFALPV
jgi:hypothetical protein